MRLLHTRNLVFEEFFDSQIPPYAILSHRWGSDEVSLQDFETGQKKLGEGYRKIEKCCGLAQSRKLDWVWIDTCCIDKKSSAELSEAINSMYRWYRNSRECYAFLNDVEWTKDQYQSHKASARSSLMLRLSEWFRRGWTLQELLAPGEVLFFDKIWQFLGTKRSLNHEISSITRIPERYFESGKNLRFASVAKRMSWAANRKTSRVEDMAYCLLGLFNINMPLLYGEGKKAFLRLQLEIVKQIEDESILAWFNPYLTRPAAEVLESVYEKEFFIAAEGGGIFAPEISCFATCGDVFRFDATRPPWSVTNRGLAIHIPTSDINETKGTAVLKLACAVSHSTSDDLFQVQLMKFEGGEMRYRRVNCERKPGPKNWTEKSSSKYPRDNQRDGEDVTCIYLHISYEYS